MHHVVICPVIPPPVWATTLMILHLKRYGSGTKRSWQQNVVNLDDALFWATMFINLDLISAKSGLPDLGLRNLSLLDVAELGFLMIQTKMDGSPGVSVSLRCSL